MKKWMILAAAILVVLGIGFADEGRERPGNRPCSRAKRPCRKRRLNRSRRR